MILCLPMVGRGTRFSAAGYKVPKYKLPLGDVEIFYHIISHYLKLGVLSQVYFITLKSDSLATYIDTHMSKFVDCSVEYDVIEIDTFTKGQADTILQGLMALDQKIDCKPLWIYNIDTIRLSVDLPSFSVDSVGGLELFYGEGDHWSFARPKETSEIVAGSVFEVDCVVEKSRISEFCSNGLYYFKNADAFKVYYNKTFNASHQTTDEHYIAPMLQNIIEDNCKVEGSIIGIENMVFCGTPEEYEMSLLIKF